VGGVRFVTGVFLCMGWIAVIVGGLASLATFSTLSRSFGPNANAMAMATAAMPLITTLLASLGPFFLWAMLKVLIEIHDQVQAQSRELARREPPSAIERRPEQVPVPVAPAPPRPQPEHRWPDQ
jgi:hypothetical protein